MFFITPVLSYFCLSAFLFYSVCIFLLKRHGRREMFFKHLPHGPLGTFAHSIFMLKKGKYVSLLSICKFKKPKVSNLQHHSVLGYRYSKWSDTTDQAPSWCSPTAGWYSHSPPRSPLTLSTSSGLLEVALHCSVNGYLTQGGRTLYSETQDLYPNWQEAAEQPGFSYLWLSFKKGILETKRGFSFARDHTASKGRAIK